MSPEGDPTIAEAEPTVADIKVHLKAAVQAAIEAGVVEDAEEFNITEDDLEVLFADTETGEEVNVITGWENAVTWFYSAGLDPQDYFESGFIEKFAKE